MFEVNVKSAIRDLKDQVGGLTDYDVDVATRRAINRSLTKGRTMVSKSLREVYTIKAGDIKKRLDLQRARNSHLTGTISADTGRLPLSLFKPSQRRDGVSVRVTKQRKVIPGAFLQTVSNNFRGVFKRGQYSGDGTFNAQQQRLPITSLVTVSMFRAIRQQKMISEISSEIGGFFPERMLHELHRIASRAR